MIIGVGIDIVNIQELEEKFERESFQRRVFTPDELSACGNLKKKSQCLAGKFAAKEAFMKAIGMGIRQEVWFNQIEVCHRETGQPDIVAYGAAQQRLKELNVTRIHISISHDHGLAVAVVILEG